METFRQSIDGLLNALIQLGHLIVSGLMTLEFWLRDQLGKAGLPPAVQSVLLIAFALLLIVAAVRLFGGLFRIAVILVLILLAIHIIMPALPA